MSFPEILLAFTALTILAELLSRFLLARLPYRFAVPGSTTIIHRHPDVSHSLPATAELTFDRFGLRPARGEDPTYTDLLIVGGSVIECLFLNDEESIVGQLSVQLRRFQSCPASQPIIRSAGKSGWRFHEVRRFLERLPNETSVHHVVVHCGSSDILHWCARGCGRMRPESKYSLDSAIFSIFPRQFTLSLGRCALIEVLRVLRQYLYRHRSAHNVGARITKDRRLRSSTSRIHGVDGFEEVCSFAESEARIAFRLAKAKAEHVTFVPQVYFYKHRYSVEEEQMLWCGAVIGDQSTEIRFLDSSLLHSLLSTLNSRIEQVAIDEGVQIVSISSHLPLTTENFYDDFHLTANGARLFAEATVKALFDA